MSELVTIDDDGQLTTTSVVVASHVEQQHASVLRLLRDNLDDFSEFGRVGFEIAPFQTAGGVQNRGQEAV